MHRPLRQLAPIWVLLACLAAPATAHAGAPTRAPAPPAADGALPDLDTRLLILARAWAAIPLYFAHREDVPDLDLEALYRETVPAVREAKTRKAFDLAMMAFMARLHNGHSWFWDDWLYRTEGAKLPFSLRPLGGRWVVGASHVPGLPAGSVVTTVDGVPIARFYGRQKRYLNASSDRQARYKLGGRPWLWPQRFTLGLASGRRVTVTRGHRGPTPPPKPSHRWLAGRVGYLRIASFGNPDSEAEAVAAVKRFAAGHARALIVDVRGNGGGSTPEKLVAALMDRRYRYWRESTPQRLGVLGARGAEPFARARLAWPATWVKPEAPAFTGPVVILVDGRCTSACEDFVEPFADNHRATMVGERTAGSSGQPWYRFFPGGMRIMIGAKREAFPDGRRFEGVGIAPDVEVKPTLASLRAGADPALVRAEAIARGR